MDCSTTNDLIWSFLPLLLWKRRALLTLLVSHPEKKKKANGRGSFQCGSQLNRTCGRVTLKVVFWWTQVRRLYRSESEATLLQRP